MSAICRKSNFRNVSLCQNTYSVLLKVCLEGLTLSIQGLVHNNTYTCRSIVWGFYLEFEFVNEILRCELSNENTLAVLFHGTLISLILPHFMKPELSFCWIVTIVTFEIERVNLEREVSIFWNYFFIFLFFYRGELHQVAVDKWPVVSDDNRQRMARMAAAAAWGLGKIFL